MKIVVINNGFVFVCKEYTADEKAVTLTNARCIRVWGTTDGLGQLVSGPTKETKLDALIPIISVPEHQIVFTFNVSSVWADYLK
jgi:hypothetical protein